MRLYTTAKRPNFSTGKPLRDVFLKTDGFHVSRICLKKGFEITPHSEDYAVFFLVLKGKGVFTDGKTSSLLGKGQGTYIPKGGIRGIKAKSDLVLLGVQDKKGLQ